MPTHMQLRSTVLLLVLTVQADALAAQAAGAQDLQRAQQLARAAYNIYAQDNAGDTIAAGSAGVLVAEGDSWFDYPRSDVLKALRKDYGYEIVSVAHYGNTLEAMAYDPVQLSGVIEALKKVKKEGKAPRAILLSGGGNDLAGAELATLLNYRVPGSDVLDTVVTNAIIERRLRAAMTTWLLAVTDFANREFGRDVPILIHGYDYPVPDARGFLGGVWFLPGPWLDPSFRDRAYTGAPNGTDINTSVMRDLINRYNRMLASLPSDPRLKHVKYVRLIGTLSPEPDHYRDDWSNELHPTGSGFTKVAHVFRDSLATIPP